MTVPVTHNSIIALDVGAKRIGIAVTSVIARLPRPLTTLANDGTFVSELQKLINQEDAGSLVIGYPRGLNGQHTAQTDAIEQFTANLRAAIAIPMHYQDEALTSNKAKSELAARGKPFKKGDVDALAATYILDDYLAHIEEQA